MMEPKPEGRESDSFQELFRDLESLPATRPDLAESIFSQARGVLSRRRWWRRGQVVLACLLCYAVGIGNGWVLKSEARPQVADQPKPPIQPVAHAPERQDTTRAVPATAQQPTGQPEKPGTLKPDGLKSGQSVASRTRLSPFETYRRVGDRQLVERRNVRSAMEYYQRALRRATEEELQVEAGRDSWLLISLKQSKIEELKNAHRKRA